MWENSPFSSFRILLVQANANDRKAFKEAMRTSGIPCEITECPQVDDALKQAENAPSPFDVWVVDHGLPGMSGLDVCRQVINRKVPSPLVFLAPAGSEDMAAEALKIGAAGHVVKDLPRGYLRLLPVVLTEAVERYRDRLICEQTEVENQKARREWEDILQAIGHPAFLLDRNHRLLKANRATLKLTGRSEADLLGKKCFEIFHNTDEAPDGCPFESMLKSGGLETVEMEMEALEGAFLVSCSPMCDEKGRIEKVLHMAMDITDHKKAQEDRQASEERHRMMIEHMNSGVAVYETRDKGATFLFKDFNPAAEKISKIKKEKVIGRELLELFPNMDRFGLVDALRRVWETGQDEKLHAQYYGDDQRRGWRENRIYKLPSGEVVAIYEDVTEKKEAENRLEASEKRHRTVLENVALAAIMLNAKGELIFCNDFFLGLTGWTRQEALGKDWFETFVSGGIRNELKREVFLKAIQTGVFPGYHENEIIIRSGEKRLMAWNNTIYLNEKEEVLGATSIGEDITDRKAQEAFMALQRDLGAALAAAGSLHEAFHAVLEAVFQLEGVDCGGIYLVDRKTGELDLVAHKGLPDWFVSAAAHFETDSPRFRMVSTGKPVYDLHDEIIPAPDTIPPEESLSAPALIPVQNEGDVIAILNLASHTHEKFPARTRHAIEIIGAQIGSAVARIKAETSLRKSAEAREVLVREVNHRVKNNLSAIISMIHGEEERAAEEANPERIPLLHDLASRIQGLLTVHRMLSQGGWRPLKLHALCEEIILGTLNSVSSTQKILAEVHPGPVVVGSDIAHHLALVIHELTVNSIKHALNERVVCRITVKTVSNGDQASICFKDNGPGYPETMIRGDRSGEHMGFQLIRGIVTRSLGGKVRIENKNGAMTMVDFRNEDHWNEKEV